MKKISERIRELRGESAQVVAAKQLGITQQGWARYESGQVTPSAELLHQICCRFNVSADWLLGLSDSRTNISKIDADMKEYIKALEDQLKERETKITEQNGIIQGLKMGLQSLGISSK